VSVPLQSDPALRPLLAHLRSLGIRTLQSCSGHEGAETHPSGYVWIDGSVALNAERLARERGIEQVSLLYGREDSPVWEVIFAGETLPSFADACKAIVNACQHPAIRADALDTKDD